MIKTLTITKTEGPVTILHLHGRVDAETSKYLLDAAHQAHKEGAQKILIDLSDVAVLTSAGLQTLQSIYKMFTPAAEIEKWHASHPGEMFKSPYFKICCPSPELYYLFNMAGFLHNIPIFSYLDDALASFAE
jgi:anti-anti-sigma regulatory factor